MGFSLLRAAWLGFPLWFAMSLECRGKGLQEKIGQARSSAKGSSKSFPKRRSPLKSFLFSSWTCCSVSMGMKVELSTGLELSLRSLAGEKLGQLFFLPVKACVCRNPPSHLPLCSFSELKLGHLPLMLRAAPLLDEGLPSLPLSQPCSSKPRASSKASPAVPVTACQASWPLHAGNQPFSERERTTHLLGGVCNLG